MTGSELAVKDEQALVAGAIAGIDEHDLVLPAIQPTQALSNAVTDGKAEAGHFYNTVTGRDYGDEIEFVIVGYQKGRFLVHNRGEDDERSYVASGDVAPDGWPKEYAGKAFVDIPDAEESWRARANDPEDSHEWGRGPIIATTHNFVGFELSDDGLPAKLGLSRTSAPAAKKILTALRFSGRAPWASTFILKTVSRSKGTKAYFVVQAEQGRTTEAAEIEQAQTLAAQIQQAGAFALEAPSDDAVETTAKPKKPEGGVDV